MLVSVNRISAIVCLVLLFHCPVANGCAAGYFFICYLLFSIYYSGLMGLPREWLTAGHK